MKRPLTPNPPEPPPHADPRNSKREADFEIARKSLLGRLILGSGGPRRWVRYALVLVLGAVFFGGVAGAYYVGSPRTFVSGFTLILPGSGAGASVNLTDLGQATSATSSAFSSASLSPTENYKRLLQSDRVRGAAAVSAGVRPSEFASARVRLVDQTPLIYVRITETDPDMAYASANALLSAFQANLDALRQEELEARELAYRDSLAGYEQNVVATRQAVIAFQAETGLISLEQYQSLVTETGELERTLALALDRARALGDRSARLGELIELPEDVAARVLILRGDAVFEAILEQLAASAAQIASFQTMYGRNHPEMRAETERHAGLVEALNARGEALLGVAGYGMLRLAQINLDDERAQLLRQVVDLSAEAEGARAEARSLQDRLLRNESRVEQLAAVAASLDALLREHQVAETVFASALARLDTSRADVFASYPLAQLLEAPALPERPSSPSKKIAALAALGGFFLYCMGVLLLWLRLPLIRALWKII
ncbi:hypothetical protein [Maricaulis sp.]|uniref:GumC family protein n=1 Tax=Maricaulis sp. TaxID=1486257 RepID=UPI002614D8A1|nr:hypothetical protein [Maricaulis sp.]